MARYFGGFRDRLKKRSKHVPVSEKDIDWVKVATTFSWSPGKRDYQWLEPEDYLSSFLNGNQADDAHENAFHGDGSMDALGGVPLPHDQVEDVNLYTPEPPPPIAYEPPYDFTPQDEHEEELPLSEEDEVAPRLMQAEDTLLRLRPEIDVQAELPMLEEYKLEIVSALQRRGRQIEADEIILPSELEQQLAAYHGQGSPTIDSYKLRDQLQEFKQQLINSHDQQASGGSLSAPYEAHSAGAFKDNPPQEDADYESYILDSLNRLEASMSYEAPSGNEEEEGEQTFSGEIPQAIESTEAKLGDPTRISEGAATAIENDADASGQNPMTHEIASEELPSSLADDSWLVHPVDIDQQKAPNASLNESDETEDVHNLDEDEHADLAGLRADNDELLKALNTISSRFPEQNQLGKTEANSLFKKPADSGKANTEKKVSFFRKEHVADEIEQEKNPVAKAPSEFVDDELNAFDQTPQNEPEASVQPAPIDETGFDEFIPENEAIKADETSLSDLLLQLRNERDDGMKARSKPPEVDLPDHVSKQAPGDFKSTTKDDASESIEFVSNRTVPLGENKELETSVDAALDTPEHAATEKPGAQASEEHSQIADLKRAKFIEDERKKLYSLIGKLEKDRNEAISKAGKESTVSSEQKAVEPPAPDEENTADNIKSGKNQPAEDKHGYSMLDASVISEITATVPVQPTEDTPPGVFDEEATVIPYFDDSEKASADQPVGEISMGSERKTESSLVSNEEKSESSSQAEAFVSDAANTSFVETKSTEKPLMDEIQDVGTVDQEAAPTGTVVAPLAPVSVPEEKPVDDQPELVRSVIEDSVMPQPQIDKASQQREDIPAEPVEDSPALKKDAAENEAAAIKETEIQNEPDTTTEMLAESSVPVEIEREKKAEPVVDTGLIEADEMLSGEASLDAVIETLAFAAEDPIPVKRIARIYAEMQGVKLPTEKEMKAAIDRINAHYEASGRAFRIKNWGGGIRMASHPQYARFIRALYEEHRPKKLSRTLMETLAIISYSQPTTKPEIDFVRGVDSDYAVRKLLEIGLIDIVGRSESIGRPLLYGTSERFLEQFGLSSLEALPKLREVEELLGDPAFKKERLHLLALEGMEEAAQAIDNGQEAASTESEPKTNDTSEHEPE